MALNQFDSILLLIFACKDTLRAEDIAHNDSQDTS